jgi:toxin ParE1/3/4
VTHEVVFAPEAQADLLDLYETIAREGGGDRALAYIERIQAACLRLAAFPERGTRRDHLRPGLRVIGFERRVAIAFHVGAERVTIDRVLYGGRDLGTAFPEM